MELLFEAIHELRLTSASPGKTDITPGQWIACYVNMSKTQGGEILVYPQSEFGRKDRLVHMQVPSAVRFAGRPRAL